VTHQNNTSSASARRKLPVSVAIGTLLVPLSAVAAIWLTGPDEPADAAVVATTTTTSTTVASIDSAARDIQSACGPEGLELVFLESDNSITDVQQAALDSLREICDQVGRPLPPAPTPDPITKTVIVDGGSPSTATPSTTAPALADDHDDHQEVEGYDDDHGEHEGDHGEHEDDDHGGHGEDD
jgi:hypothetical protein